MNETDFYKKIAARAISLGASLVGVARLADLMDAPSHRGSPLPEQLQRTGSLVILALAHGDEQPEMDWWDKKKGRTPGNRLLRRINRKLAGWLRKTFPYEAHRLPYMTSRGGIFLKDAAVLAGLGVIGKNNLLITPQYGPRVRFRALLINRSLPPTGPMNGFAPCQDCSAPCMTACPEDAFAGRSYHRNRCLLRMKKDEAEEFVRTPPIGEIPAQMSIAYCRSCELSCPVGRGS